MAEIVTSRNLELSEVDLGVSLGADFDSKIIDFKEMNSGFIQVVTTSNPSNLSGKFHVKVSLLCNETTFVTYPNSERFLNDSCNNFGWEFCCLAFRYAKIFYVANSTTDGLIDIYARAKRT